MNKKIITIMLCILFIYTVSSAYAKTNNCNLKQDDFNLLNNPIIKNGNLESIEVIDQQQTTDCGYGCPFFSNLWLAQGFIPTLGTITKVELKLFKVGTISSDVILSIRSTLTESDLTSITIDGSLIHEYSNWIEFDITDIAVEIGEMYYIVCRTTGGSMINYYCCLFQTNNPYSGGEVWGSLNSGSSWEIIEYPGYPDPDGCFKSYGLDEIPNIPNVNGPNKGTPGIEYTYKVLSIDPENHQVFFFVEWGDGTNSGWLGPYDSGEEVSIKHSWTNQGSYTIKVKAKDSYGATSEWGIFTVVMPKNKSNNLQLFNLLENHLYLFQTIGLLLQKICLGS
ncbi:hypothetical protein AYK24_02340 [Thermoplasmatales archaeon SG8-52-4]|nr:MAG: hypothetical protein AYK24_02340 [Thermoplasmatales archaeon SG8-52-4]